MSGARRTALGVVAFAPITAIVAFSLFLAAQGRPPRGEEELMFLLLLIVHWKPFAAIVAMRVMIGIGLAIHAWRHLPPGSTDRTLWALRLFFFTELRAPQYWLEHVR